MLKNRSNTRPTIFCVNLDLRPDRWLNIVNVLAKLGVSNQLCRFRAVDFREKSIEQIEKALSGYGLPTRVSASIGQNYRRQHCENTIGSLGCFVSHVLLWSKIKEASNDDPYLIIEDDIQICNLKRCRNIFGNKDTFLQNNLENADLLLIGHSGFSGLSHSLSQVLVDIKAFQCTHAYAINRHGAKKLICSLNSIEMQLDWQLSALARNSQIKISAIAIPPLRTKKSLGSDIQTEIL